MRSVVFLFILLLANLSIIAQSPAEKELSDLIKMQVFDVSDRIVPVIIPLPGAIVYGYSHEFDNDAFFTQTKNKGIERLSFQQLALSELREKMPAVISTPPLPENFRVQAFYNSGLSASIQVDQTDSTAEIVTVNVDGSSRRETRYLHNRLTYQALTNSNGNFITQYEYADNLVRKYHYNSADKKYQITEENFSDGRIVSLIRYRKSRNRNTRHISTREEYAYDADGRLAAVRKYSGRHQVIDSSAYIYSDHYVIVMRFNGEVKSKTTCIYDDRYNITEKRIEMPDKSIVISYRYDESSRLSELELRNKMSNEMARYTFSYDAASRPDVMNEYRSFDDDSNPQLCRKLIFQYNGGQLPELITQVDPAGKVTKSISYAVSIL